MQVRDTSILGGLSADRGRDSAETDLLWQHIAKCAILTLLHGLLLRGCTNVYRL